LARAQALATHRPELMTDILFRWANFYADLGKSDSTKWYINQGIRLAEKHHLKSKQAFLLSILAKMESGKGKGRVADSLSQLAFGLCQNRRDSADVLSNFGGVQKDLGKPEEAAKSFLTAYKMSLQNENYVLAAFVLNQYATILRDEGQSEQAIKYLEEVVRLSKQIHYNTTLASAYNSLGVLFQKNKNYDQALTYYELAMSLKKSMGRPKKILITARNMAELYWNTQKYAPCLAFCQSYIPLSIELKNAEIQSDLAFLAAMSATKTGQKKLAQQYVNMGETAMKNMKTREEMPEVYQFAAQTHALMGHFEQAYAYQIQFKTLQDSITSVEKSRTISELETRYETNKKAQQIAVLAKDNELKRTQQYALFGGLASLILLALGLGFNIRSRKRSNDILAKTNGELTQKNHEIQTLLREIHHRVKNNLQIISSLLRLQARRVSDENALDALQTGQARVRSMSLLHQRLYQGEALKNVPMRPYFSDLTESLLAVYQNDDNPIDLQMNIDDIALDVDTAVPLGLIANELITNALKYAFVDKKEGKIELTLRQEATGFRFLVTDNGIGIPLSINGKPVTKRTSFGLELVESLAQKLKGTLLFSNENGGKVELIF
jgi:two-component system, sensor histidine kinase PdtaS